MPTATGTILLVQESRFRLLAEDGRGMSFLLAHDAALEPQDLPALAHRRVRVDYRRAPGLMAAIAHDLHLLERLP